MNETNPSGSTTLDTPKACPEKECAGTTRPLASILTASAGVTAGLLRLVPHPPNFSSVGALGLFGGARLRAWHAYALPIGIMIVTDLLLWVGTGLKDLYAPWQFYHLFSYAGILGYVLLGRTLTRTESVWRIGAATLAGGLLFFLITNFGAWLLQPQVADADLLGTPRYSRDLAGLGHCYLAALPFYQGAAPFDVHQFCIGTIPEYGVLGTILGDLFFVGVLFGAYAWLTRTVCPKERVQPTEVSTAGGAA
jgi:hypothetical protein